MTTKFKTKREPSDLPFIYKMITPSILLFILGIAIPLVLGFYISFINSTGNNFLNTSINSLQNYLQFLAPKGLQFNRFYQYFYQTLFFIVISVSLELLLGMIFALIVNRSFRGRGLTRAALLIPWALPTVVSSIIFLEVFAPAANYGVVNSFLQALGFHSIAFYGDPLENFGSMSLPIPSSTFPFIQFMNINLSFAMLTVILIETWKTTPFIALLILAALQTVPEDLYKAADIEGASAWQKFRYVTWPLIRGPVIIAVIFRMIEAVRVYDSVVVFNDSSVQSLTVLAVQVWNYQQFGVASAIAIFELLMVIFFIAIILKATRNRLLLAFAVFLLIYNRLLYLTIDIANFAVTNLAFSLISVFIIIQVLIIYNQRSLIFEKGTNYATWFLSITGLIIVAEFILLAYTSSPYSVLVCLIFMQLFLLNHVYLMYHISTIQSFSPTFTYKTTNVTINLSHIIVLFIVALIIELSFFIFGTFGLFLLTSLAMGLVLLYYRQKISIRNKTTEYSMYSSPIIILTKRQIMKIGFALIVILMLLFCLSPFLWVLDRSFRNPCLYVKAGTQCTSAAPPQRTFELIPQYFSLQSYTLVLNSAETSFAQALINGFFLSGFTAIIVVIIGSLVAVVTSKYHFPYERYLILMIFAMTSLPPIVIIIPYLIEILSLKSIGVDLQQLAPIHTGIFGITIYPNTFVLLLPYAAVNLPLGFFLLRSFFAEIPDELVKAAKVDGASNTQIFTKILFPLTRPGIFTTAMMVFIEAWNELLFARLFLIANRNSWTVPLAILQFAITPSDLSNIPWVPDLVLTAAAVVSTLPLIIIVLVLQRQIISGMTAGAVKG